MIPESTSYHALAPCLALSTAPTLEEAEKIAETLVEEQLAACVNIIPGVRSVYRWQGSIHREAEVQLVIKTVQELVPALKAKLNLIHPHETPEFVVLAPQEVSDAYLHWLRDAVKK